MTTTDQAASPSQLVEILKALPTSNWRMDVEHDEDSDTITVTHVRTGTDWTEQDYMEASQPAEDAVEAAGWRILDAGHEHVGTEYGHWFQAVS